MAKKKKTSQSGKSKQVQDALAVLGGTARVASEKPDIEVIPTGMDELDHVVFGCGGLPRGRIIELYAPESVGKSTISYWLAAQVQKQGLNAVLFDAEGSYVNSYGAQLGIDNDALILPEFMTGNDCLFKIKKLVATQAVDLIIVDSIPALQPKNITDTKDDTDRNMRDKLARAQMLTDFFNDLMGGFRVNMNGDKDGKQKAKYYKDEDGNDYFKVQDTKVCLIFINHAKTKLGVMFGDPTTTPGGKALKFASSIRLGMEYSKKSKAKTDTGQPVYKIVSIVAAKNKLAPPLNKIKLKLITGGEIEYYGPDIVEYVEVDEDEEE